MNSKEVKTIEDKYYNVCIWVLDGYDYHQTTKQELSSLMDMLGLKKNRYRIENNVLMNYNNHNSIVREAFNTLFDNFTKYKVYTNFDIDEIEMYFDNLKYDMNDEEIKCNKARIRIIKESI